MKTTSNQTRRLAIWLIGVTALLLGLGFILYEWRMDHRLELSEVPPWDEPVPGQDWRGATGGPTDPRVEGVVVPDPAHRPEDPPDIVVGTISYEGALPAEEVLAEPMAVLGEQVKVRGTVDGVLSEHAFLLDRSGLVGDEVILVVDHSRIHDIGALEEGDEAVVEGSVTILGADNELARFTPELDPYIGSVVIVAALHRP